MFTFRYLDPEGMWAVYAGGIIVALFMTPEEAEEYCNRHNQRRKWTADEILEREG